MTTQSWLPLTDYSIKYKVSISTLRRRIKNEKIQCRLVDGKYLLLDTPVEGHSSEDNHSTQQVNTRSTAASEGSVERSESTTRMLDELKKAYSLILQEKEQQILRFKEEIADLRTLVRVLEAENERLSALLKKEGKPNEGLPVTFY